GLIIMGLGMGFSMTPATETITSSLPADRQGVASALNDITRELGTALGVALLGPLVTAGCTGRIFNIHYLTKKGVLDYPILYLSRYILENKEEYYAGLSGVTQRGSWDKWLLYILKAVEVTANMTYGKINDIVSAKDAILHFIETETDFSRPDMLVGLLFTQPFTRVKHLQAVYAENTARKYLDLLAD